MHWSFEGFQVKEEYFCCKLYVWQFVSTFPPCFSNIRLSAGNLIN